jgi:hypothetical protein
MFRLIIVGVCIFTAVLANGQTPGVDPRGVAVNSSLVIIGIAQEPWQKVIRRDKVPKGGATKLSSFLRYHGIIWWDTSTMFACRKYLSGTSGFAQIRSFKSSFRKVSKAGFLYRRNSDSCSHLLASSRRKRFSRIPRLAGCVSHSQGLAFPLTFGRAITGLLRTEMEQSQLQIRIYGTLKKSEQQFAHIEQFVRWSLVSLNPFWSLRLRPRLYQIT